MTINFCISVKFRAFGVTLGTYQKQGWLGLGASKQLSWGLETGPGAPAGARMILNERGVSLQAWI